MITQIPKNEWKEFFDNLSRDLDGWETHIDLFSNDTGAQVISSGLPFHGLTVEVTNGDYFIELLLGNGPDNHQTHTIAKPILVAFEGTGLGPSGILDIEDEFGTKTLIKFIQPFPILAEYVETELMSVASVG